MKWTKEQENVIKFRNRNILVSAAAGSGKTAVLVERIIQRITDEKNPMDIDKLLVVTFTKAAAAEMRERIGSAIEAKLEENPEDENLRKQQTLIHNAQITTIDSFCLFVVRNHFQEIGLEPNFRIADTGEIKLLEMDVLNEVFEAEYEKKSESFLALVDAYSDKRSNKAVKNMVSRIYSQSSSNPWPKEWIRGLAKPYEVETKEELLETDLIKGIFSYVKAILSDMPGKLEDYRKKALEPDGPFGYVETIEKDLDLFQGLEEIENFSQLEQFCKNICANMGNLTAIRNFTGDPLKKEAVSAGRNGVKKEVKELTDKYFSLSLEDLLQQLHRMKPVVQELIRVTLLYQEAMEKRKREKHMMDFSDIEHGALNILVDAQTKELRPTALEFQQQFDEIMIDEYQDSNQVQEEIMCAISRQLRNEYNMFMVGDVKQSIYRFRLARPELFMEKFEAYDLEESVKQRIDLHKNFRSRSEVLDFTNDIFYKIMDKDLGNVVYDEDAALYVGADYPENPDMKVEVLLYETENEVLELSSRQLEAHMVADRILELKKNLQVTDKATGLMRPLRNSDIVLLFRSLSGWGNEFASVLGDYGIPAHVTTATGYFSALEVQTVLSFLKILDNPYQDIPMAAVLKSAIVGLDNEEMAEISLTEGTTSFAEAALKTLREYETLEEEPLMENVQRKLIRFGKLYFSLRKKVLDTPIHQLIECVLEETGYGDYVKALPAGAQRKANLDMLVEKAIAYEKTSFKGLFHFIRYIDQLQKYEVDFGEADVTGENEDVVRLMTIHKSKGLEFPVVFVCGISKKFNDRDSKEKLEIHPDMGLGMDEIQIEPRVKRKCLVRSEIAERIRRDNLGEELRILYVAMTRAKEKLILTGTIKSEEKLKEAYAGNAIPKQPLSFGQRVKANSYLDWVAPAVLSYPFQYQFICKSAKDLIWRAAGQMAEGTFRKIDMIKRIEQVGEELVGSIQKSFAYEYPYLLEKDKKTKYSVSEIKHASMVENYDRMEGAVEVPEFLLEEREPVIPSFARERLSTSQGVNPGALRGTAVHRVMECLDFKGLLEIDRNSKQSVCEFVEKELSCMLEKKLLPQEQYELINKKYIESFLYSEVALAMAQADARGDLFKEKPFVMDYNGVLVQGIIDVFWLEEDTVRVLDYKTDRVEKAEELVARYKTQLDLYADALCRIFSTSLRKIEKSESLIYSFRLQEVINL